MNDKEGKVTRRTRNRAVRKFGRECASAWDALEAFVKAHCKRSEKARQAMMDELCPIVDRHIIVNCRMRDWCYKNGVDFDTFVCDVINHEGAEEEQGNHVSKGFGRSK